MSDEDNIDKFTKRQKLDESGKFYLTYYQKSLEYISSKRKINICHLPSEVIQNIFQWLPASYLAHSLRLVCKHFESEINIFLNFKFRRLYGQLIKAENYVKDQFEKSETYELKIELFTIYSYTKLAVNQYKLVEAGIWRYTRHKDCPFIFCICGAKMLEYFDDIKLKIYNEINTKFTDIMILVFGSARDFTIHFERYKEMKLNTDCFASGAKLCDILDCHAFAEKDVVHHFCENGLCSLKIIYKLHYAWFSVLNTAEACNADSGANKRGKLSWQEEQMLMYMRMRRLVLAHTGMYLALLHENFTEDFDPDPENPYQFLVCGYGGDDEEFFYYGCYNQAAYNNNVEEMEDRLADPDESSNYCLEIIVNIMCPIEQAPLFIYKQHCMNLEDKYERPFARRKNTRQRKSLFKMQIDFTCELSKLSQLPWNYVYVVTEEKRMERPELTGDVSAVTYDLINV